MKSSTRSLKTTGFHSLLSLLLFLPLVCFSQKKILTPEKYITSKYSGVYQFGSSAERGRFGLVSIYAETDSTVLFYIELNRGAPSFNNGSLYGRLKITNDIGTFYRKSEYDEMDCKWGFKFTANSLIIKTIDNKSACDFGSAVYADGAYKRTSAQGKDFFTDMSGRRVYFTKTKPEDYN